MVRGSPLGECLSLDLDEKKKRDVRISKFAAFACFELLNYNRTANISTEVACRITS